MSKLLLHYHVLLDFSPYEAGEAGEAYNICHDEETRSIASIAQLVATHVSNK